MIKQNNTIINKILSIFLCLIALGIYLSCSNSDKEKSDKELSSEIDKINESNLKKITSRYSQVFTWKDLDENIAEDDIEYPIYTVQLEKALKTLGNKPFLINGRLNDIYYKNNNKYAFFKCYDFLFSGDIYFELLLNDTLFEQLLNRKFNKFTDFMIICQVNGVTRSLLSGEKNVTRLLVITGKCFEFAEIKNKYE